MSVRLTRPEGWTETRGGACGSSSRVSARMKIGDKGRSHCDRSRVAEGETVEAEHQALPGGSERLPNILKEKHGRQRVKPDANANLREKEPMARCGNQT